MLRVIHVHMGVDGDWAEIRIGTVSREQAFSVCEILKRICLYVLQGELEEHPQINTSESQFVSRQKQTN